MSAREEFPMTNWQPIVRRYCLEEATYDAMCDRIDTLTEQNQLLRNLIGNAEGAALDAGLLGDTLPHDSIYALAVERDTLTAEVAPWRELKSAMNRNELAHEDAYYAVERAAREEGKQ